MAWIPYQRTAPRRALRWLLLWPLYLAFQTWARRRLKRHLALSHLGTVFLSVLAICVFAAIAVTVAAERQNPVQDEPAMEAQTVVQLMDDLDLSADLASPGASTLLRFLATGDVGPNLLTKDVNFYASIGRAFAHVRSISVVDPRGRVVAASDAKLIGQDVRQIGPAAPEVALRALRGSTDTGRNSVVRSGAESDSITGAYPLRGSDKQIVGAVVVDKSGQAFASNWQVFLLGANFVAHVGVVLLILVGLPAIPLGLILGLRRARSISRPVQSLSATADRIAGGDLTARAEIATAVEIAVRDTGAGIPPGDLPRVFERFYRAEQSRNRASGGAGLGLAIARQLIEGMGGTITAESRFGEGSTFTITLPRATTPARSAVSKVAAR